MPFHCPEWPPRWPEIEAAVARTLNSGDWGRYHASICDDLRTRLIGTLGVCDARLCCSGTAALEVALRACQVGQGDEVILAAYDYPGNFRTIELLGARPVLVDVAPGSASIDPNQLAEAGGDRVRAVVASHLYGRAAPIEQLRQECDRRNWVLIEDACQVPGMQIAGRPAGSLGHFATLSFGGSKLISAGSGGALLAGSDRLAARLGALLDRPGDTYPLSTLQAAVIHPQLDRLEESNRVREATARFLQGELNPQLPRWTWRSSHDPSTEPAYYKVAWSAESAEHRQRIIAMSQSDEVPIGAGFRSMSRCSQRRCRKPVPTPNADALSETLFLLDHRALLLEPSRHGELAECLSQIYNATL